MHRPIFWHSFAVLVAPILLSVLAFKFLNKRKANARGNAEDADTVASASLAASTSTNSGGSSSIPTKSDVAGSMSSTTSTGNCFDVFLNFRGQDTRYAFTDHLYRGLIDAGIDTFRDDDELSLGEEIGPELMAAIRNSKILIPILSVTYGTSSWCLDELAQMMELRNNNGRLVLPIFYKVKPAEVRHQTGDFGKAFHERERRMRARSPFDPTNSEKWKKALGEVSTLKGYEANGYEGELVKSIVLKVLSELKKEYELVVPENLVGIGGHVEKIMKIIDDNSSATLFIGIHGMGGIGKTTLAEYIYKKLSNQFKYCSFIADIRESCQRNGIVHVQNQLIFDILNQKDQAPHKHAGIHIISSKFKNKKVLILLDDVDHLDQLKALVGHHNWFSSGSRVLITTRNCDILKNVGVDHKYELEGMNEDDSMVLFCRNAFRSSSPPSQFKDLARDVITTVRGLPLSLEVLGSLLCGKKIQFWRDTICKLKKAPPKEVQEKLRVSYEVLDDGQKQIFLDIACLFIGTDRRIATHMWDANNFFPGEGIEVLIFMSLIKCGDDHVFWMHDQLRDLGRAIVREKNPREPQYHSRLWDFKEARKVLEKNQGTNKIEAIDLSEDPWMNKIVPSYLSKGQWEKSKIRFFYTGKQFKNMTSLRFLQMERAHLSGDYKNSMEELRWLRWRGCPMDFEVTNFHVKELVILELPNSPMVKERERWRYFMMAENLKYLDISNCYSLKETDFLSAFKKLEVLILYFCSSLKRIDSSIGDMKNLRHLDLGYCKSLVELPAKIGDMKNLRHLDLGYCESLVELPAEIGELKALEQLLLHHTKALSTLPGSITSLENLEILDLSFSGIEELPEGIGKLRKLRELNASSCSYKKSRWSESDQTYTFTPCSYSNFYKLQSLPDLPPSLKYLSITCESRKLLSLSHLVLLKELTVFNCKSLECIELPSALLKTSECSQLIDVEESPQSLNPLFELEYLNFILCSSIETLDVSECVSLRALHVEGCGYLLEVRGIDKLIYLKSLTVKMCNSIGQLDLLESKTLKYLDVSRCPNLAEIQGIDRLEFLIYLNIYDCTSLKMLLLPKSRSLRRLNCSGCKKLTEIEGLHGLKFLEDLNISKCKKLTEIQGLHELKFLEQLNIFECTLIKRVILPESRSLKSIRANGCNKLVKIEGLDRLEFLERLSISNCTSIKRLEFPESGRLKGLFVDGCENLVEIQGLDKLEFLRELSIFGCKSLKTIPELSGTHIFRKKCSRFFF